MSLYYCGESGCKGHHSFSETCADIVKEVRDYAPLMPFIQGIGEEETQPFEPIKADDWPTATRARGTVTQEMKAYKNKAALPVPAKIKTR
jgi:hypothetical protein